MDYKAYKIGDFCKTNINTYSTKEKWEEIHYLDTGNITAGKIDQIQTLVPGVDTIPSRAKRKVQINDIIYSTVRPNQCHYGIIKEYDPKMLVSTGFAVITVDPKIADADYIYYFLTQRDVVETLHTIGEQSTSAYPSIKPSDIENLEIALPDIETQQAVATLLRTLDEKCSTNDRINSNLQQQAYAYFLRLFIENANPAWRVGTISDLGTVVGGGTPSKAKPEYYTPHGIAWITPKDLSLDKSKFIAHGELDISELGYKNSGATKMPAGTVLFSSRAPIGYIAIANNEVTTNQGFKSVVPHPEIGTPYVYYFLIHNLPLIESKASGSTFKEVSGSVMKSVEARIPDCDTIAKFNDFCNPIFEMQKKLEQENKKLVVMRDLLLSRLLSGEIDVTGISL